MIRAAVALLAALCIARVDAVALTPVQKSSGSQERGGPQDSDAFGVVAAAFSRSLDAFRGGDDRVLERLRAAASQLASEFGRSDAPKIVAYYAELAPNERRDGVTAEQRLDALRAALHALDEDQDGSASPEWSANFEALRELHVETASMPDQVPAAHCASLLARLIVRRVEERTRAGETQGRREDLALVRQLGAESLARFERAGQRTPRLEPHWVLARSGLISGDLHAAEASFLELVEVAEGSSRLDWLERGLLGLIGVVRDRGGFLEVDALLAELAAFRDPKSCWALAREYAVQRLSADEGEDALRWLLEHRPSASDDEINLERANAEWRALISAARLRSGLEQGDGVEITGAMPDDLAPLLRATLALEAGRPEDTLVELEAVPPDHTEGLVLRGRALVTLGRPDEAIAPLRRALDASIQRDRMRSTDPDIVTASAVGEWLGLSAVEALARAYVDSGAPVSAAAAIEAAHALCSLDVARERLLERAAEQDLGCVTWVIGADASMVIHVDPRGRAVAQEIPRGRKDIQRAVRRARDTVIATRSAVLSAHDRALLTQISSELLPRTLLNALEVTEPPRSVTLLAHGAIERLPLECLPTRTGEPLGLCAAIAVETSLRDPRRMAPAVDLRRATWLGLGAPRSSLLPELEAARRELTSLAQIHPRFSVKSGIDFDAAALIKALNSIGPVHVATHVATSSSLNGALASGIARLDAGLLVSGDRVVTMQELKAARPRLPLLVIAACSSGDGLEVDGLGLRGLAQIALESGTRATVMTLWQVSDQPTYRASLAFHGALLDGFSPAEALRRARMLLAGSGAAPADWSAFRLLGASE